MPRRRLTPEARRNELISAALTVFRDVDISDCRVEDITQEARTAKGNFYRYFSTFDDLVIAVRAHILNDYRVQVEHRLVEQVTFDWWQILEDEIDAFVAFQIELGPLHDAIFHSTATQSTPIDPETSASSLIAVLVRAGIDAQAFRQLDVDTTAPLLFHLLHGAVDEMIAGADPIATRAAVLDVFRQVLKARDTS